MTVHEVQHTPRSWPRRILRVVGVVVVSALLLLGALAAFHHTMLPREAAELQPPGTMVEVDGREIHVYAEGNQTGPTLVLLAGAATIAPVYDFAPLYEQLSEHYRVVVAEKTGYG